MSKIVISIVSHKQGKLIENLLRSLDKYFVVKHHEIKLIITKNVAEDFVLESIFEIKVIDNLRQKGFGVNHNQAFQLIDSDYFIVINPDIILVEEFDIDFFVRETEQFNVDITSPIIVNEHGVLEDYKRSDLNLTNLFKRHILGSRDHDFQWYAGMFLIIKSKVFRELSGFDPKFFMYVEDCDLCARANKANFKLADVATTTVAHLARRDSRKKIKNMAWHVTSLLKYFLAKCKCIK